MVTCLVDFGDDKKSPRKHFQYEKKIKVKLFNRKGLGTKITQRKTSKYL